MDDDTSADTLLDELDDTAEFWRQFCARDSAALAIRLRASLLAFPNDGLVLAFVTSPPDDCLRRDASAASKLLSH